MLYFHLPSEKVYPKNDLNKGEIGTIVGIVQPNEDELIIASAENGLWYFNKQTGSYSKQIHHIVEGAVIPFRPKIDQIYLDKFKNLWISSPGKGIYFTNLDKVKFKSFHQHIPGLKNFPENSISLSQDQPGFHYIKSITRDNQGRLWCLTQMGIAVLDKKRKFN